MGFGFNPSTPTSLRVSSLELQQTLDGKGTAGRPRATLKVAIERAKERFEKLLESASEERVLEPGELAEFERRLHREVAQECLDPVVAAFVQELHYDHEIETRATVLKGTQPHLKLQAPRQEVNITFLGGSKQQVISPYYLSRPPRGRGRPRKTRRKSAGRGLYPFLEVLGLHFRASLSVTSEVARLVAIGTIEQAKDSLERRGISVGRKVISRIAKSLASRGLAYRDWAEEQTRGGFRGVSAKGLRLGIGCDGGRVRLRFPKKRGRPRKSGRRGYDGEWKEPKILVVYELDEKGRKKKGGLCRYDASMLRADDFFGLLRSLLREIGAHEAAEWVILGDGADWIWNRVPALVEDLGFDLGKVTQVVDYYHAVEQLHRIVAETSWSKADSRKWVARMKSLLLKDRVQEVVEERKMFSGRNARRRRNLFNYFRDRADKMLYGTFKQKGIPLGSGAIESCVRRVVNLRLKGNGIFWTTEGAEQVLHLRAQLLCGRWDAFVEQISIPKPLWSLTPTDPYETNREKGDQAASKATGPTRESGAKSVEQSPMITDFECRA